MTGHPSGTIQLVSSYASGTDTEHLAYANEDHTFCGRNRYGWMVLKEAELPKFLESAYGCKRCKLALVS